MKEMNLGDRMKMYENFNKQFMMPNQYVLMRLDGKNFSKFTKKYFEKPFDGEFSWIMQNVMEYLVDNISGAVCGYTQSDEITLLLTDKKSKGMEGWFNYRVDKLCSIAASKASAYFTTEFQLKYVPESFKVKHPDVDTSNAYPIFDCRVWQVPNDAEVKNVFLWRQRDCIRNSILQYAESFFSHTEMMNKNVDMLKDMIREKGYDWDNDLDNQFKYGSFYFPKGDEVEGDEWFYDLINSEEISAEFVRIFNDVFYKLNNN